MSILTLELVRNELIQIKMLAEANIEHVLMDKNLTPEDKKNKIIIELEKLKDSSVKLSLWENFIADKVVIPEKENNN